MASNSVMKKGHISSDGVESISLMALCSISDEAQIIVMNTERLGKVAKLV